MKRCKWILAAFISAVMLTALVFTSASAARMIDLNKEVNLTISYQDGGVPLADAPFAVYQVAVTDKYGELTVTEPFDRLNVDINGKNEDEWRALSSTLEGYVLRDQPAPADSGKTDKNGILKFPAAGKKLTPGLYLVLGQRHIQGKYRYDAAPFMVMLPARDRNENVWVYDAEVYPKHEADVIPEKPNRITRKVLKIWKDTGNESRRPKKITVQLLRDGELFDTIVLNAENNWRYIWKELDDSFRWTVVEKEVKDYTAEVTQEGVTYVVTNTYTGEVPDKNVTPGKPNLPQTGQLWWPVAELLCGGLLFIIIGLMQRRGDKNEKE